MMRCTRCKKYQAMHTIGRWWDKDENLCCRCNVEDGGAPSDWHPDCMVACGEIVQGQEG